MKAIHISDKFAPHSRSGMSIALDLDWEDSSIDPDMPGTRLHSEDWVSICGLSLHVTALEVVEDPETHEQRAADPGLQDELEGLFMIDQTAFQTTEIDGRDYVIYATPAGA